MKILNLNKSEHRFRLVGILLVSFFLVTSVFAPVIAPYDPYERVGTPFERPCLEHILGCNDVGHDLFSELIYGGRVSLFIGLFASFYSTLVSSLLALAAGYYGGRTDRLIMRTVDVVMSLPFLPLVIVLGVFLGPGISTQIIVITTVMWAHPCRELRSQVMKIRESGYIDAARSMGERSIVTVFRHVLPELMPLIVPQFVRVVQQAIMIESSLSFLGLGDPVLKSWGSILFFANTRAAFLTGAWVNWVLPPGLCIAMTVLGFSFIGFSLGGRIGLSYYPFGSFILKRKKTSNDAPADDVRLSVNELVTVYNPVLNQCVAVNDVCFDVKKGEMLGLVGESGCGKSTIAMSVLGMLRYPAEISQGVIILDGKDLLSFSRQNFAKIRGRRIAYIPQNAMNALNPVVSIKKQLIEAVLTHQTISRAAAVERVREVLEMVEIPEDRINAFNHELSGGMKQRVVIAMALVNNPDFLIADEPTTGLDVLVQQEIVRLLVRLKQQLGLSILFITHDLPLVMTYSDKMAVMYQGEIVDSGSVDEVYYNSTHVHTKALFSSFPCLFEQKRWKRDAFLQEGQASLVLENVTKSFYSKRGLFAKGLKPVYAVKDVSLSVMPGEVVGLIGGSGSGKSTIARLVMGLETQDEGKIFINGLELAGKSRRMKQEILRDIHLVFQDPYQSMRSHMKIFDIVAEPLRIHGTRGRAEIDARVRNALREVSLPCDDGFLLRHPSELSGGQRQRLSFARAIVINPKFIIADEPTSMLDVSLRSGLLELMEKLRSDHGVGFVFITHDLALARHFCDRLLVLNDGSIIEQGESDDVVFSPVENYTKRLISAVEEPDLMKSSRALSV
ncbi:MAG: nickel ABC transporter ATP-binding protein NikE [Spirochaetales bacterium]|nr:nickel ABC transporter ATP-binding protein NikE [Spirochaetales bacterium]